MLTWAVFWFAAKAKADPQYLPHIAMALDTWVLIEFARAIGHL